MKHHLAGTQKDVGACKSVSDKLRQEMWDIVVTSKEKRRKEDEDDDDDCENVGFKRKINDEVGDGSNTFSKKRATNQSTINSMYKKSLREDACLAISRYYFNNAIAFNTARSEEFRIMCDLIAKHGPGFKPPSYHEIRVKYLKQEVESTERIVNEHRSEWKKTGCTIMSDEDFENKIPIHGVTIPNGRKITTYIYSRPSLIPLLHHFTDGKDLVRPGMTRFATAYLTLGCLYENKGGLIRMFTSEEWKTNKHSKIKDGKVVEEIVLDKDFWKSIVICLKGALPLIEVLRLVDSDEHPAMGFLYEAMDRAKEKIQAAFQNVKKSYRPLWSVIDLRWNKQLHRPLHAAGYYLNPRMHYSPGFKVDYEVKQGVYDCLRRMVADIEEQARIDVQLQDFKKRQKLFGSPLAQKTFDKLSPADWWDSYGDEHPDLQKLAIRVLSLTCSSSGCERNWSAFEMVHTKRRNRMKQKTMNDVVFVMTNSKLAKKKKARRSNPLKLEYLSSDDEWIMEDVGEDPKGDEVAAGNNSTDVPTQNGEEEAAANVQPEHEEELDVTNLDEGDEDEDQELEDYDFSIDNYVLDV
ncbi:unnamed protein product [Cuscuta campestris]|uniref:HAT C-terminal dimerisation domain-containing protein n=1 Tax=Cuscuta campestris TaxID=132261 RepID=A0A484LN58_9ASTE|nr:unnamed protein product [Cuscuta campestris]